MWLSNRTRDYMRLLKVLEIEMKETKKDLLEEIQNNQQLLILSIPKKWQSEKKWNIS